MFESKRRSKKQNLFLKVFGFDKKIFGANSKLNDSNLFLLLALSSLRPTYQHQHQKHNMSTTIVDNSAQHIQQLNHNLRLEILSFLDTVEHRSLHNYGYFLSDPTRTIYRIHNFYPWISLEDEPIDSLSDHLLSKSKTITIYLHTELKKPIEQKLKRFAQRMPK
jgi:hypothetical protein